MKNLLEETVQKLVAHLKTPDDVRWVGNEEVSITWEQFSELADNNYDERFGRQDVARDLMVVGDNWWLERGEYDGSEWWEFKSIPITSAKYNNITVVMRSQIKEDVEYSLDWRCTELNGMNNLGEE